MNHFVVRIATSVALATALLAGAAPSVGAAAVTGGVGVDYVAGPERQSTRDVMGFLIAGFGGKELSLSGARYTHSDLGSGTIGSAGFGIPLARSMSWQTSAARTVGDETYRAWLFQTGPLFQIGGGRTLGFLYSRAGNNLNPASTGVSSEIGIPLSTSFNGTARGSVSSMEGGGTSLQGSVGMIWGLARRIALLAEIGAGRDGIALAQGGGTTPGDGGVLGTGVLGTPSQQSPIGGQRYVSGSAVQIGIRYIIH